MEFIDRFRASLRINTAWPRGASPGDSQAEGPLRAFQDFLAETYPAFNRAAERWVLSPYSLVYRWPGAASAGRDGRGPVLFLSHYDVVPAETEKWTVDPFGGDLRDEPGGPYVYGRGALDMKNILMALMESAEELCKGGFVPRGDIWFAFGGDEERSGILGAQKTVPWLAERGLRFSWILDEGGVVAQDQLKGVTDPLALVGIEEKGYLSLTLSVDQKSGHASQPPAVQAVAVLARALARIDNHPFPFHLVPTVEAFFSGLAPHVSGGLAAVLRNARLLGPLFFKAAATTPVTAAMMRTTIAMTQLQGSAADNVMPSQAQAVLNLRLLPPWTVETAVERIKDVISDPRVTVALYGPATDPVPAAPGQARMEGPGWKELRDALEAAFPGVPPIPYLMMATTDSRHYRSLGDAIFRFGPQRLTPEELSRIHGKDERISLVNLERSLVFYTALLRSL
ncbi:MAG: M20/M25/M40 family metallo-hydrolase [Spirochaetaceae bacterium]|jgi:carboxypeptidase PM20D1|nr:M20/M25/M40 family metallo-hydrolase [Spirochaetaceae bacterium]